MSQQESRISETGLTEQVDIDAPLGELEAVRQWGRVRPTDEASIAIARQLNGPLTALLLYMGEIKQHSRQLSQSAEDRAYLQKIVDNALQQTERVCALVKQIAVADEPALMAGARRDVEERSGGRASEVGRTQRAPLAAGSQHRPLTKREREVLQLISEGYSNKQGALRMRISPRTFESHRAEAMRKLGARNTAELVRTALLLRIDERLD
jgi:DNA-binding CsgD family transcriptional regulator